MDAALRQTVDSNDSKDSNAFSVLLARHRGIVHKIAHSYAWQPEDRADLVQEIAARLWAAWPSFSPERSFSTWMYRVALNVAIDHVRAQELHRRHLRVGQEDELDEVAGTGDEELERQQHVRLLERFIRRQPALDRALLLLYLDGRPQGEIAEVVGLSLSNVSTRINRLKRRLRDEL